jgi:zinc protease
MRRFVAWIVLLALAACGTAVRRQEKEWQRSDAWPFLGRDFHLQLAMQSGALPRNQVRFVVLPDPTAQLVQLDVRVDVGAAQDPPGKHGLAHLTEHVLFLGRPGGAGTPRLEALLRAATVSHNAYTNLESTHYQNLLRPDQLERVLELEASRYGDACRSVDAKSFERERDVVRNELREHQAGAGPLSVLSRAVYGEGHPYIGSPGGSDVEVAALTLDDVCNFVDTYYAPAQLIVIAAGRLDPRATIAELQHDFGALEARPHVPAAAVAPARSGGEQRKLEADVDASYLVWSFPVPARHEPLGLASQLIVEDLDSALDDALGADKRVADHDVFQSGGERAPFVIVAIALAEGADARAVEKLVRERLALFANAREATEKRYDWVPVARTLQHRYFMRLLFRLEGLGARTDLFADYAQLAPAGTSFATEYDRLAEPNIQLAEARALFEPARAARFLLVPGGKAAHAARAATVFSGEAREEKEDLDVDASEARRPLHVPDLSEDLPEARRFVLDNGLTVILQPAPSVTPLVVAKLVFAAGSAHEPADKAGLAEMTAFTFARGHWVANTGMFARFGARRAAARFGYAVDDADEEVEYDVDVSADTTEITSRFPTNDAVDILHGLAFRLNAFADPAYIDLFLRVTEQMLHKARRGLGSISAFAFATGVFGPGHPYARTTGMTLRSLMRIEPGDVTGFMNDHYVGANATLILTGAFDPKTLEAGIRDEFGRWPTGVHADVIRAPARERKAPLFLGVDEGRDDDADAADTTQLELTLGYPAPAGVDNHRAARLVLARMLDLRAASVRERIGASYGLSAGLVTSVGPGAYVVTGEVDPARAGESLALLRAGIAGLRSGKGFDEDFARARRFVLAELLARSSSPSALAARWAYLDRFGRDAGYFDGLARAVANLDPTQVHALVDTELAPGREVVVLTGSRAAVTKAYAQAGLPAPRFMKRWPPPHHETKPEGKTEAKKE